MKKKLEPSIKISIDKKIISQNNPVYFIAEIGSNFDNDLNRAKDLIYLAKNSGADAVKFQHYTAKSLVSDYGFKSLGSRKSHQEKWMPLPGKPQSRLISPQPTSCSWS